MLGRRIRIVGVLAALVLLASGCQWAMGRFDPGNTADNTTELHLSSSNISHLGVEWSAGLGSNVSATSEPVAAGNTVFVGVRRSDNTGTLYAFPADASSGCTGSPTSCTPLWTASGGAFGQPLVYDGVVYVDRGGILVAYDAAGATNCSGSPVTCQPLWSGTGGGADPVVAGGLVYVVNVAGSTDEVDTYSPGAGSCPGSPPVCSPVTRYQVGSACPPDEYFGPGAPASLNTCEATTVAVDGSRLDVGVEVSSQVFSLTMGLVGDATTGRVAAFAVGQAASPAWTTVGPGEPGFAGVVATGGNTFTTGATSDDFGVPPSAELEAVTSSGQTAWATQRGPYLGLAVSPDEVFAAASSGVDVYAVAGEVCGSYCEPTRQYPVTGLDEDTTAPAIGADVLYVGVGKAVSAYSATGTVDCDTGTPTTCAPLATVALGNFASQLSVSNGRVFVTTQDGRLLALTAT